MLLNSDPKEAMVAGTDEVAFRRDVSAHRTLCRQKLQKSIKAFPQVTGEVLLISFMCRKTLRADLTEDRREQSLNTTNLERTNTVHKVLYSEKDMVSIMGKRLKLIQSL